MKQFFKLYIALLVIVCCLPKITECLTPDFVVDPHSNVPKADWVVVGAGPAGLCVIGVLVDIGVNPQKITWIDPEFSLGSMGSYYSN